jgi:ATP-dependent DNA helicase DinG
MPMSKSPVFHQSEIDKTEVLEYLIDFFSNHGLLAETFQGFEARDGQRLMARAVMETLLEPLNPSLNPQCQLAVEAGTGVGKTLAYLIPAVLSNQKIVISTNTRNLQEQILKKEIPFIREHLAPDLTALCVKGRQNYLCLHRWHQFIGNPQRPLFSGSDELARIDDWLQETETGDRAELYWLADEAPLWQAISSTTSQCLGIHCPEGPRCFITRLRKKAAQSRILIVNHHLFFSDLALRRFGHAEVLPRYESVIFDEAHHLEGVATRYFGNSFSHYQLLDLVKDIEISAQADLKGRELERVVQSSRALAKQADHFIGLFPKEKGRFPLLPFVEEFRDWQDERRDLLDHLEALAGHLDQILQVAEAWNGLLRRCRELIGSFETITEYQETSSVYWYERREKTLQLSASPIEVGDQLNEHFYRQVKSVVFTSATLTTGGSFRYFLDRLGLSPKIQTLIIDTPFDYRNRTRLYIPPDSFPLPAQPHFQERLQEELFQIVMAANGRSLLLFTSITAMKKSYQHLADRLPFPVFVQGEAAKTALLENFQQQTHSVLLAVASFWEGIDVPGESLSCVIIDKLPFEVPSDPVIMARAEKIKAEGGNPFFDFQVPRAILTLRQGVGRLMRSSSDRGVLAIIDVRLFTKKYGGVFLKSLPPSPIVRGITQVQDFFKEEKPK